jgi:hypothetical protein
MMRACVAILSIVLVPALAAADPAKDRALLAQFEAAYQATAKASGAARTNQACTDASNLMTTGDAFSHETAPADAPVDDITWSNIAGSLGSSLADLVEVCKRADRKRPLLGNKFETADEVVTGLDKDVHAVLDAAKPRALPAAMTTVRTALATMSAASKSLCTQQSKLAKALAQLAQPPSGADAAGWKQQYDTVKNVNDGLKSSACGKHRDADEQIGSSLVELHEGFYALVLLVPPR